MSYTNMGALRLQLFLPASCAGIFASKSNPGLHVWCCARVGITVQGCPREGDCVGWSLFVDQMWSLIRALVALCCGCQCVVPTDAIC